MVTPRRFSTGTGPSPVPDITGSFAGTGGFTVSPAHGTPSTESRQFQAGPSTKGQGASQNPTLFVMTSQISTAPKIGFTQAGVFHTLMMHTPAAVSSATPTLAPNAATTVNGRPVASFPLISPIKAGSQTTMANNHPTPFPNGYAGRVTVAAVPSTTSFATAAKSPLIGNGAGRIAAPAGSFLQGGPTFLSGLTKTTPLYGVTGGSLILNGTGGYLGSGIFAPRKP
jgi:hypothetical protein